MKKETQKIEIPFGAFDSELHKWEYTIPEGYEAEIKDGKVIVTKKESEDERIRKALLRCCDDWEKGQFGCMTKEDIPEVRAYLERKKEQKPAEWSEEDEKMLDNTLDSLKRYQLSMPNFQVELQMRWLKSLRPQPKQKRHLGMKDQWCCSAAWAAVRDSDAYNGEEKQFILNFLQRCKPQPHWKPSEEQMRAVFDASERNDKLGSVLRNLYDDLKKF